MFTLLHHVLESYDINSATREKQYFRLFELLFQLERAVTLTFPVGFFFFQFPPPAEDLLNRDHTDTRVLHTDKH